MLYLQIAEEELKKECESCKNYEEQVCKLQAEKKVCSRSLKLSVVELNCDVLCCVVLSCEVLYCAVLYCTVLCGAVLCCHVLYGAMRCCTVLYCTVLCGAVLCCHVLYYAVRCCTVLYCDVLCLKFARFDSYIYLSRRFQFLSSDYPRELLLAIVNGKVQIYA